MLGCHYYSFWYLIAMPGAASATLAKIVPLPVFLYLLLLVRRVYAESWLSSSIKTAGLSAALVFVEFILGAGATGYALWGLK